MALAACGDDGSPADATGSGGGAQPTSGGPTSTTAGVGGDVTTTGGDGDGDGDGGSGGSGGGAAGGGAAGGGAAGGGGAPVCEAFGRWPAPESTFTLGAADLAPDGGLYVVDIQARYPEVDWTTVDRLYIEAGDYAYIWLGGLPDRDPERPLIISNLGGQVHVGPAPSENFGFLWVMDGGSNWVLTGRYDPEAETGDEAFPGHRCGAYASSQGSYGFLSDDEWMTFVGQQNHMGLNISADAFELEYVEIARSSFAGLRIAKPDVPASEDAPPPLVDAHVHDNYIHDVGGEGLYFGMTTGSAFLHSKFIRLRLHDNRILRTANEVAQLQDLGAGTEIHHNVFGFGAMNWRNAFQPNQDNSSQLAFREGDVDVHHNAFLRGSGAMLNFFGAPEPGDAGGDVTIRDNYFEGTTWLGVYLGARGESDAIAMSYAFADNVFRGLEPADDHGYFAEPYYPERNGADGFLFRFGEQWTAAVHFANNRWEGPRTLLNGPKPFVTEDGNVSGVVDPVRFVDTGLPEAPYTSFEFWVPHTGTWAGSEPVTYEPGALVFDMGRLYRCVAPTTAGDPGPFEDLGGKWEDLGAPADDFRLAAGSPWPDIGLTDRP